MLEKGPYDAQKYEPEILKYWLENKFFKPEYHAEKGLLPTDEMKKDGRESFCIVNPPPNAYMRPHIGNVSGYAYQDVFLRYNRMKGKKVLGQPGKDHAGIQGEVVLEKIFLENKKKTKQEMGREKFYMSAYSHFQKLMPMVMADEQRIGLSSDYDRNLFTLDPKIVHTVLSTFTKMFEDKMVYKGVRIVNWDPVAKTTLADIDTERVERETELVYIKYPLANQKENLGLEIKKQFEGKTIKWTFERDITLDKKFKLPFHYGSFNEFKIQDKPANVIGLGYSDLKVGEQVEGEVIGVQLNLTAPYRLVVLKKDAEVDLQKKIVEIYDFEKAYYAGAHIVLFKGSKEEDYCDGIIVATTRAETMLGDTAVIVNPGDERYKNLIGEKVILPLVTREIPIISSARVEKEFGTGAVKLTPAHAYDDYVMMNEWNLSQKDETKKVGYINVINKEARMDGPIPEKYKGLKTEEARKEVEKDLADLGLIVKREKHLQSIMIGERSKAIIEQIMSSQWFVDVEKLKGPAIDAVKNGEVKIHPDYMVKKYLNWMENLHDWPVSRSLWWGYRIPVWYRGEVQEMIDEKTGQIVETIHGIKVDGIYDAVEKGLAKVQIEDPNVNSQQNTDIDLTFMRHGGTDDNAAKKFSGWTDHGLNNNGKKQASVAAESLVNGNYDIIISSDLKRAKETAEIIAKKLNLQVKIDPRVKERHFGVLDGLTWDEFKQKYPEAAAKNKENYQPELPDGESIPDVEKRVKLFLDDLKRDYKDKKVLLVTHTGIIRILQRVLQGKSAEETRIRNLNNCEMVHVKINTNEWILIM